MGSFRPFYQIFANQSQSKVKKTMEGPTIHRKEIERSARKCFLP